APSATPQVTPIPIIVGVPTPVETAPVPPPAPQVTPIPTGVAGRVAVPAPVDTAPAPSPTPLVAPVAVPTPIALPTRATVVAVTTLVSAGPAALDVLDASDRLFVADRSGYIWIVAHGQPALERPYTVSGTPVGLAAD